MTPVLKCIMLIDDNQHDNFFHEREIKKNNQATIVITQDSGTDALEYLASAKADHNIQPDLIFVDINMPAMNGWEFIQEYNQLEKALQNRTIIIMLTTSDNLDDQAKSKSWSFVSDCITKPLTREIMKDITDKYFN